MLYYVGWVFFFTILRVILAVCGGLKVYGLENVPRKNGLIIAPNHLSFSDPPIVEAVVRRGAWFMATDELFEKPILGPLARMMRGFPVKQDSPDRAALRKTENLLKRGEAVVVFPEGHVSKDGVLQAIQPGTVMVALRTGVPVLPIGLINTDRLMPPHSFRLRRSPRPIEVRIGRPITAEELAGGLKGRAAIDHGSELLRKALLALTGQPDLNDRDETNQGDALPGEPQPERTAAERTASEQAEHQVHLHAKSLAEYSSG